MQILLGIVAALAIIGLAIGAFILSVWIIVWNTTDIAENGVSFWNVFWLLLVASTYFGSHAAASRNH